MAKGKSSSRTRALNVPADQYEAFRKLIEASMPDEKETAKREAQEAEREAQLDRSEHPSKYLTDADLLAIERRLWQVLDSVRSIHGLAGQILGNPGVEDESVAIQEMARANIKGIDACLMRITGSQCGAGNFADELAG